MPTFQHLYALAEERKGGKKGLQALLDPVPDPTFLSEQPASFYLGHMTKSIFQSGFVWKVIEKKWPDFKTVFLDFDPHALSNLLDEEWDGFCEDARIVRNRPKIQAVRDNVEFILRSEKESGNSFGALIAQWPVTDQIGLLAWLKKEGSRLGGMTGQYILRRVHKDGFMLSKDVVRSLQDLGLDIKDIPASKGELKLIQEAFNRIHLETQLPMTHISRILAYATGENIEISHIQTESNRFMAT